MDQQITGNFIARKRKKKNLTQEQIAEKLGRNEDDGLRVSAPGKGNNLVVRDH